MFVVAGHRARDRQKTHQQHQPPGDRQPSNALGQRSEHERAHELAHITRRPEGSELQRRQMPFLAQDGHHRPDYGAVQGIEQHENAEQPGRLRAHGPRSRTVQRLTDPRFDGGSVCHRTGAARHRRRVPLTCRRAGAQIICRARTHCVPLARGFFVIVLQLT